MTNVGGFDVVDGSVRVSILNIAVQMSSYAVTGSRHLIFFSGGRCFVQIVLLKRSSRTTSEQKQINNLGRPEWSGKSVVQRDVYYLETRQLRNTFIRNSVFTLSKR